LLWGLGIASVMLMATGIWYLEAQLDPIRFVRVEGDVQHLHLSEVEQALRPVLQGYWSLDLDQAADAVRQIPWVDDLIVRRIWPDVLELEIHEQVPQVRWGAQALLNRRGEKFLPGSLKGYRDLPQLKGPENYRQRLFRAYHRMAEALAPLEMRITGVEVDSRRSWQVRLEGEMAIQLGRVAPEATFLRLARALVRLGKKKCRQIERLDGRYEHGFAIRWRAEGATQGRRTLTMGQHG